MSELITISLISAGAVLFGAIIGVSGQIIGNKISHKNRINSMTHEYIFKEKIGSFKKVYNLTCKIKKGLIEHITTLKRDKENLDKLIFELNNELFLFSSKKLLENVKKEIFDIQKIVENPPEIVEKRGNEVKIKGDFNPLINQIGGFQSKIINEIKRELKIEE